MNFYQGSFYSYLVTISATRSAFGSTLSRFDCLLCPLCSMSANALRLRLSSLAVTKVSVTYTHKKMSTANSVLVFIMCRNETCSEQSERNSERGEFTHRSERQSDGTVRTMQSIVVRKHCAQVQVSMTARQNKKARINPCSFWWCRLR